MLNYELMLELNIPDFLIYQVYVDNRFTALFVFEDAHRQGELMRDFPEYHSWLYESEEEWDDFRNLIHAKVFFFRKKDYDKKKLREDLCYIANVMIENKMDVNPRVKPYYDTELCKHYKKRFKTMREEISYKERSKLGYENNDFLNYVLSLSENYSDYTAEIQGAHNLTQRIILKHK